MQIEQWAKDLNIDTTADFYGVTAVHETIARANSLSKKEGVRLWIRKTQNQEQHELFIKWFKDSPEFEDWLETPDELLDQEQNIVL